MQETPPRRRRPPRDDGPSLPFIPIVLGVIVVGFVIGAGLSVAGRHTSSQDFVPVATATATATASDVATFAPATFAPASLPPAHAKPKPSARPALRSPAPALEPSTEPSVEPAAAPSPAESAPSSPQATAQAAETAAPATSSPSAGTAAPARPSIAVAPRKPATPAPAAPAAPTAPAKEPQPTPAPATPAPATAAPATAAPDDVTSGFGRQAAGVVRAYLAAVARGDTDGAYAQLGTTAGVATGALPEAGIVTRATRIVHVEARGGDSAVTVNVDMQTPSGAYFGQYTVHRSGNGAAIIVQHSIFKS
jgi:hypothetical protein